VTSSSNKSRIEESEALLAAIRNGVLVHLQDGLVPSHLRLPLESAQQLSSLAPSLDDEDVKSTADVLTTWLALLAAESAPISDTRARSILDQITMVEVALNALKSRTDWSNVDLAEFLDETFNDLQIKKPERKDEFEIDSEMAEIFREEAESLLETIQANLEILRNEPDHREALWEIKRAAHTFKGASGVVGFKRASTLAHRIEGLLADLSERDSGSSKEVVVVLLKATECLPRLIETDVPREIETRFVAICEEFDRLSNAAGISTKSAPVGETEPHSSPKPTATEPQKKSRIVRVSLDRLDELVQFIRDLVGGRPALAKEIANLTSQLEESRSNQTRLQHATSKLEAFDGGPSSESSMSQIFRQTTYELSETTMDSAVINTELDEIKQHLESFAGNQHSLIQEIYDRLVKLRNMEFGSIATRLQRTVSVTCDEEDKRAELVIEDPRVEIDAQLIDVLMEPLLHLLKNSIVHGIETPETRRMLGKSETGSIIVSVENRGTNVVLKVADDGRGIAFQPLLDKAIASGFIDASEKDRLTRRRLHELLFLPGLTTAKELSLNAGRGVGMSIVRESITAAGGTIEIETSAQRGTTFIITIPRIAAERTTSIDPVRDSTIEISEGSFVLIVDDSPSIRASTSKLLDRAGWSTETAVNGAEALEKLRTLTELPSVIMSDIEMPEMNGYEFITELRRDDALKDIPFVFVSSRSGDGEREKALATGADDYVIKPYNEKHLAELIGRLAVLREKKALADA
jgi:CheY-like chemotaxis protein